LLLVLAAFALNIFSSAAQSIESKILYPLKPTEKVIFENEYRLSLKNNQTGYILFVERMVGKDTVHFAIHNGKEYGPYESIYDPGIDLQSSNGHFFFIFYRNGKCYVNNDGTEFGPYDNVAPRGGWYHLLQT